MTFLNLFPSLLNEDDDNTSSRHGARGLTCERVPGAGSALSEYLMLRPSRPRFMDEEAEAQKGLY